MQKYFSTVGKEYVNISFIAIYSLNGKCIFIQKSPYFMCANINYNISHEFTYLSY